MPDTNYLLSEELPIASEVLQSARRYFSEQFPDLIITSVHTRIALDRVNSFYFTVQVRDPNRMTNSDFAFSCIMPALPDRARNEQESVLSRALACLTVVIHRTYRMPFRTPINLTYLRDYPVIVEDQQGNHTEVNPLEMARQTGLMELAEDAKGNCRQCGALIDLDLYTLCEPCFANGALAQPPRQSGRTTKLLKRLTEEDNVYLVVHSAVYRDTLRRQFPGLHDYIIAFTSSPRFMPADALLIFDHVCFEIPRLLRERLRAQMLEFARGIEIDWDTVPADVRPPIRDSFLADVTVGEISDLARWTRRQIRPRGDWYMRGTPPVEDVLSQVRQAAQAGLISIEDARRIVDEII